MNDSDEDFHEFDGVRFYAQQRLLLRVRDRAEFFIRPKERDFLQLLIRRSKQTVLYEEFREQVWPDVKDVNGLLPTLRETKRTLDDLLGEITKRPGEIIETVAKRGYRLNVEIKSPVESEASEKEVSFERRLSLPFGGHGWHILAACCLYGALYSLAVPLELAYQFDRFGTRATLLAPAVFSWMVTCSAISLYADWKITLRRKHFGLAVLILGFLASAILLYIALIFVLPDFPITESKSFQAHTAQGAYLKNIAFYFLPLGILFFALPYHFVVVLSTAVQNVTQPYSSAGNKAVIESGTVYISVRTLGLILFGAAIVSVLLTFHLLDNLMPNPYRNLFTQLVILRATLLFGLGLECVLWYSRRLNEINHLLRAKNFQT